MNLKQKYVVTDFMMIWNLEFAVWNIIKCIVEPDEKIWGFYS